MDGWFGRLLLAEEAVEVTWAIGWEAVSDSSVLRRGWNGTTPATHPGGPAPAVSLQERLTSEIADALDSCLKPAGVLVEVEAQHGCVSCRGVRQDRMVVVTRARRGSPL